MLKIGLTGGIGCGKSTVSDLFSKLNIPVIDADLIAHQLVEPGEPALDLLVQHFGSEILSLDGHLHRARLREIVFTDRDKKKELELILHPLIYQKMQAEYDKQHSPYCIFSIPLLIETNMTAFVDRILVIDCPLEIQISRVRQRDDISRERILSIINSQVSHQTRIEYANDVIDNSKSTKQLAEQVKKLHNQYLVLNSD